MSDVMVDAHDDWVATVLNADPRDYQDTDNDTDSGPGGRTKGLMRHPVPDGAAKGPDGEPAARESDGTQGAEAGYRQALKEKDWRQAAIFLNFSERPDALAKVAKLPPATVALVHEAAIKDPDMGQNSLAAQITAALAHPVLGGAQAERATALEKALSPADAADYKGLLDGAKSDKEKQYLRKGLAAGHTVAELKAFDAKIAGKDEQWLQDNLALTGDSKGKGVKQQWSMSCNATTAEAVKAELDPLYALKMHEDNPKLSEADDSDANKLNPNLAADQKAQLQSAQADGSAGGQARNRGDAAKVRGRWNTDLLNKVSDTTGLSYGRQRMDTDAEKTKGVADINAAVDQRMPVPLVVGDGGANVNAHYVLITASDPGPPRYYSIHDPASGDTVIRSEDQLKTGNLDLGGWDKIAAFEKPTKVEVKPK